MKKKNVMTKIMVGIMTAAAVFLGAAAGSISGGEKAVVSEAAGRPVAINSCTIQGGDIVVNVSASSVPGSDDGKYYLYSDEVYQDGPIGKVVATVLDYLTLCHRLPEDREHNDAVQLQMLANRFHNHSNHNGIFFATGFQLETAASQLAASGKHNIVKQYNESHLSDCKGIKRELDQLFFLELEKNHHGVTYLTMAWNKNRYEHHTAAEDKYFAYRFTNFGILDDVDGEDKSVKDIYADDESDDVEGVATTHVVDIF